MKKLNLIKDLGFVKTGVKEFSDKKKYYSTKSIQLNKFTPEGEYTFKKKPSRANRLALKGDVIQARMQFTNKATIVDDELNNQLISTGFFQLRPPKEIITSKYLFYLISSSSFLKIKDELCTGATQKAIGDKKLKTLNFNIPSIDLQKKITDEIDKIYSGLGEIDKNISIISDNVEIIKLNYLSQKYSELIKNSKIDKFSNLVDLKNGINFEKSATGKKFKILGVKDFKDNFFAPLDELEEIKINKELKETELIKNNDIIFVRSNGNPNLIGRTLLIKNLTDKKITFTGFSIRARLKKDLPKEYIYLPYLCYILKSNNIRKQMSEDGNGIDIKSLSQGTLNRLDIPIISYKNQIEFVREIETINDSTIEILRLYNKKKELLKLLKDNYLLNKLN